MKDNLNQLQRGRSMAAYLLPVLKGALIGAGAILPGISGGVLCIAMGVYQPLMAMLSHPFKELKARLWFFLPLLIGFAFGVLGLSRGVDWLFRVSPIPAVWLFIGLIAGTLPGLWREAGKQKNERKKGYAALGISFCVMLAFFLLLKQPGGAAVAPNFLIWLLCGALWGIGFVAPGMSPSSIFIFMGVYQPMAAGIADLSFSILLPMGLGLLISVLAFSRLMNFLLKKHFTVTMHVLLGTAIASTFAILPFGNAKIALDYLIYALCFIIGLLIALWMEKMSASYSPTINSDE